MSIKHAQLWLRSHYRDLRSWVILFLSAVALFILFSQNAQLKEQNRLLAEQLSQATAKNAQHEVANRRVLKRLDKNTEDIKVAMACLLKLHDENAFTSILELVDCRERLEEFTTPTPAEDPQSSPQKPLQNQNNNTNNGGGGDEDNDGVIVDLPLLPRLHIPSPF